MTKDGDVGEAAGEKVLQEEVAARKSPNVDVVNLGDREFILVGTAHVSRQSAELAERVILEEKPDAVAVELCEARFASLRDPKRWRNTDVYTVVKEGRSYVLLSQLILAAFQKKLGKHLDVKPGAEMMRAVEAAEACGAQLVLADRDVRTTLKRTWHSLGLLSAARLIGAMIMGLFTSERLEEEEIERLKSSDALEELMRDFSERLPDVRVALIDERDEYLASKIAQAPGKKIVAVIGAGHIPGIKRWIAEAPDCSELEKVPPAKLSTRLIGWGIPALVVGLIAWGFFHGSEQGWKMIETWILATSITGALGAALALAHPVTIAAAFVVSPFTALHPLIASGWIAGLVEAAIRKPRVADLENIADDVTSVRGIWSNRVSRVLLVVLLTNLCGSIGTLIGIYLLS